MAPTISFSGLASGLDTSSWVEAFVSIKQQKVTALQTDLKSKQTVKNTLNDTRSKFTTLRSAIEKLTDAKFGGAMDLFAKNSAISSDTDIFTATATASATRTTNRSSLRTNAGARAILPCRTRKQESSRLKRSLRHLCRRLETRRRIRIRKGRRELQGLFRILAR